MDPLRASHLLGLISGARLNAKHTAIHIRTGTRSLS
jgi:hypothetical protein